MLRDREVLLEWLTHRKCTVEICPLAVLPFMEHLLMLGTTLSTISHNTHYYDCPHFTD